MNSVHALRRSDTHATEVSRAAARTLGRLVTVALVVFHVWLLWTHIATGKLLEPDVILRWGLAGIVIAALSALHRMNLPLFWGRRAVVLWLLVILIHAHAAWTGDAAAVMPVALPQAAVELIPIGLSAATLTLLSCVAWLGLRGVRAQPLVRVAVAPARFAGLPAAVGALQFSPRPPPAR